MSYRNSIIDKMVLIQQYKRKGVLYKEDMKGLSDFVIEGFLKCNNIQMYKPRADI